MNAKEVIKNIALQSFDLVGFCSLKSELGLQKYRSWIEQDYCGDMSYLKRHLHQKENPDLLLHGARSWISLAFYYDTPEPLSVDLQDQMRTEEKGWIARYARGQDYHSQIKAKLINVIGELKSQFPEHLFWPAVDSSPVLERDIGARSGLGWVGKNSCLIHPQKGSFFFLAEILTTLLLSTDNLVPDHCGNCNRCIDACPTNAILPDRTLDARLCISYWTIEAKTEIPKPIQPHLKHNLFGCDICQDVCPWNQKARRTFQELSPSAPGWIELKSLLDMPDEVLKEQLKDTALSRTKPQHLKATARILKHL